MTPQRRGLFATLLGLGLVLLIGVGVALAVFMNAKPSQGPRDDGSGNQQVITLSGDLLDGAPDPTWLLPRAYWDVPDPSSPAPAYQIPIPGGGSVEDNGEFSFNVNVPLTDGSGAVVRPGAHVVTVCAVHGGRKSVDVCTSDGFTVQKGLVINSRDAARPGEGITTHGERFSPGALNERVLITLGGTQVQLDTPASSTFDEAWTVPNLAPGTYKLKTCNAVFVGRTLTCVVNDTVTQNFTILEPKLNLAPTSGFAGEQFEVTGSGFYAGRGLGLFFGPVGSQWDDPGVVEIEPAFSKSTDDDGDFGPYAHSPTNPPGDYWVIACTPLQFSFTGSCAPGDTVHEVYTILAPTPSPSPTPSAEPTDSPTPSPSPTPSASPSPSPTPSPTPSLAPTVAPVSAPPTETPSTPPTAPPSAAPTPAPAPTAEPAVTWPEHLRSPGQTAGGGGIDLGTLGGMSLLALLIAFLVPFPGTLFNKTVEANHTEIMGWIAGLKRRWNWVLDLFAIGPLGAGRRWLGRLATGRAGVLVFLGLSALVYSFLSPTFGFDTNSVALFLGLLVGLAFITAAFDLPLRIYHGRTSKAHDRGVLRALWWTLLVAVICVVVSRLANFQPGYLYGLVVSIVFVTEISRRDEGIGVWLASFWLIILSFAAWILLALVRQGSFDPWVSLFVQTMLVTFVVAGIETLVIGLLPMRFLPGHPLYQWKRSAWFVVFALSVMGYLLILVDPANGYLSDDSRTPMLVGVIFLVTFGLVSVGTWAYFRYRPERARLEGPPQAPST